MRIISRKAIRLFTSSEPSAEAALDEWYRRLKALEASGLVELRRTFPAADLVGKCIVFNVGGNKYRVITKVNFQHQTVYVRFILTHKEYDKDKWKSDCC